MYNIFVMVERNKKYIIFSILIVFTVLVVLCGVLFSVEKFYANCCNATDENLNKKVQIIIQNQCENKSVFLINETNLKMKIESDLPQVEVVNVERVFPDKVRVNYVLKKTYAYTVVDGKYKYFSKDGKVLCIDGGDLALKGDYINVITTETTKDGDFIFDSKSDTGEKLHILLDMMEKVGVKNSEILIDKIDFTCQKSNLLQIKLREGAVVNVEYPSINFREKVRLFASAIINCEKSKRIEGLWKVYSNKISYVKN